VLRTRHSFGMHGESGAARTQVVERGAACRIRSVLMHLRVEWMRIAIEK